MKKKKQSKLQKNIKWQSEYVDDVVRHLVTPLGFIYLPYSSAKSRM